MIDTNVLPIPKRALIARPIALACQVAKGGQPEGEDGERGALKYQRERASKPIERKQDQRHTDGREPVPRDRDVVQREEVQAE